MIKDFFGQLGIDEVKSLSEVYYISIVGDSENENIVKGNMESICLQVDNISISIH